MSEHLGCGGSSAGAFPQDIFGHILGGEALAVHGWEEKQAS